MTATLAPAVTEARIGQFLTAARETIADVPYCWLATRSVSGGANARAVKVSPGAAGDDEWTRRILVRRGSRKVSEIRLAPQVTLAYQHDSGDRYVALSGQAILVDDRAEMRTLWPESADARFPEGFADANMIVLRVDVDRIEIHARGVTREPFGYGRTLIERDATNAWRFVPD